MQRGDTTKITSSKVTPRCFRCVVVGGCTESCELKVVKPLHSSMMAHSFTWVDHFILMTTTVLSIGVGLYQALARGRQHTTDEYMFGSRQIRVLPATVSLSVSYVAGVAILGYPAEMYFYGMSIWFVVVGIGLGIIVSAVVFVPLFYPLQMTSINEYLEQRFQSRTVVLLAWFSQVLCQVVLIGMVLFAPAVILEAMAGFPPWASMLAIGVVGTAYTSCGGLRAVIWADVFQAVVILGGLLAIVIKGTNLVGGIGEVMHLYHDGGRLVADTSASLFKRQTVWGLLFNGVYIYIALCAASQTALQRFSAVSSLGKARRTVLLTLIPHFTLQALCCLSGVVAYAYFAKQGCDPLAGGYISSPNQILPFFVMSVLDFPGCSGAFCAAVVCGTLSNLSSSLTSITALTWSDLLAARLSRMTEAGGTNIARIIATVFGLLSIGFSYTVGTFGGTLMQIMMIFAGVTAMPSMTLFALGPLFPRLNWKSVTAGVVASILFSIYFGVGGLLVEAQHAVLPGDTYGCLGKESGAENGTGVFANETGFRDVHYKADGGGMTIVAITETPREMIATESSLHTVYNGTDDQSVENWKKPFQLSHTWVSPFAFLTGAVVAILASLLPGCYHKGKATPRLYFHCVRTAMRKRNECEEYEAVDPGCEQKSTSV